MEDYSIRGYLKRRSTEELDAMLLYCLQGFNYIIYEDVILEILRILDERFVPDLTSREALRVRELLLQYTQKK